MVIGWPASGRQAGVGRCGGRLVFRMGRPGNLYDLWLAFYDLASLSLILFDVSGVYLRWRLARRRWLEWAFLGVCWGYASITIVYLVHAP